MSFQQGLSGLNARIARIWMRLAITSFNSSCVSATKAISQVQFSDVYASTLTGSSGATRKVGISTQVARVAQLMAERISGASSNPLDMAINGGGFSRMSTNWYSHYTRNGQFTLDQNGFIWTNASGAHLTGYLASSTRSADRCTDRTGD